MSLFTWAFTTEQITKGFSILQVTKAIVKNLINTTLSFVSCGHFLSFKQGENDYVVTHVTICKISPWNTCLRIDSCGPDQSRFARTLLVQVICTQHATVPNINFIRFTLLVRLMLLLKVCKMTNCNISLLLDSWVNHVPRDMILGCANIKLTNVVWEN